MKIDLRGANLEALKCNEPEFILSGPAECLSGDTIIEGTGKTIQFLCDNGIAPIVQTLHGPKQASIPFKKGIDDLYEITAGGKSFRASARHLVLTNEGYVFVEYLHCGQFLLSYEQAPQHSIVGNSLLVRVLNVYRYWKTIAGFQFDYPRASRFYDAQPHLVLNNAPNGLPLLNDVHAHIHDYHCKDAVDSLSECIRHLQPAFRPSNGYFETRLYHDLISNLEGVLLEICERTNLLFQQCGQYAKDFFLSRPALEQRLYFSSKRSCDATLFPFLSDLSFLNDTKSFGHYSRTVSQLFGHGVFFERLRKFLKFVFSLSEFKYSYAPVSSIRKTGKNNFYDLIVPGAHHYFANGFVHHNTGKTFALCLKTHIICSRVPGAQGAIGRKTYNSLKGTVIQTFNRIIKGSPVRPFGGENITRYIYPNGSSIWLGGMDNPNRMLSAERDFIYMCQAEELSLDDWEILKTRATGRGAVVEFAQLFGDCNPSGSMHWIRQRAKEGKLKLLLSKHTDNPTLFDKDGWITKQGKVSMAALESLSGVRKKRLLEGIWATAEGAVYENFDPSIHVVHRDPNEFVNWYLAMDEGFTNPQVTLLVGADGDGRWHIFKESYVRGVVQSEIVKHAFRWFINVRNALPELRGSLPVRCEICVVDNAAPGLIADLQLAGIHAIGGKGALVDSAYNSARGRTSGIYKIQDRLVVPPDGKPRLTVEPGCTNTINEFESYIWKEGKDEPVKENDHAMDAIRYLQDVVVQPTGAFTSADQIVRTEPAVDDIGVGTERITFDE